MSGWDVVKRAINSNLELPLDVWMKECNGIAPNNMKYFNITQGVDHANIYFVEPDDTIIDGNTLCMVAGIKIMRKDTGYPNTPDAGIEVADIKRSEFGKYGKLAYKDTTVNSGKGYYYTAFPYSYNGVYNMNPVNINHAFVMIRDYELYGYDVDPDDSDPGTRVSYPKDVDNYGFSPITVNLNNGSYDTGSWGDTFMLKKIRPVMLKYTGEVDYELNHYDQNFKLDGSASDVSNKSYAGNAMVEFPKMYFYRYEGTDGKHHVRISNKKINNNYKCYQHMYNGREVDTIYLPMYEGSMVDTKVRSLAGQRPCANTTGAAELAAIKLNGAGWQFDDWINTMMVQDLMFMCGKSTDVQSIYGNGHSEGWTEYSDCLLNTGTTTTKGMFFGKNTTNEAVKVFFLENYYGDRWDRKFGGKYSTSGEILFHAYPPYEDASFIDTGITLEGNGTTGGFISKTKVTEYGTFPAETKGSSSTFMPDGCWHDTNDEAFLLWGGCCVDSVRVGCAVDLDNPFSAAWGCYGPSLAYKNPKAA